VLTGENAPLGLKSTVACVNRFLWKFLWGEVFKKECKKRDIAQKTFPGRDLRDFAPTSSLDEFLAELNEPLAPCIIGCSALVVPLPKDVQSPNFISCGWWVIESKRQIESFNAGDANFGGLEREEINNFLKCGQPPVYIGWGSMLAVSAEFMTELAVTSLEKVKQRGIVLSGWHGLGLNHLKDANLKNYATGNVLFVNSAPHEWIFPKCILTVTHGGSGSTAAAMRSGKPSIITPVFLDQYDFAASLSRLGVGVGTCQLQKVTSQVLAAAIDKCRSDSDILKKAAALGEALKQEDGIKRAAEELKAFYANSVLNGTWEELAKKRRKSFRDEQKKECLAKLVSGLRRCLFGKKNE